MRYIFIFLLIITSTAFACPKSSETMVQLDGTVYQKVFPGPPNYYSIKNGDRPEKYWILKLKKPACFDPDGDFVSKRVVLDKLQLLLYKISGKIKFKKGRIYRIKGLTVPQMSGHHKTKVMIEVVNIEELSS